MDGMQDAQRDICRRYRAEFMPPEETYKIGISQGALRGDRPLNGLRHPLESGTTGWFLWAESEWSDEPDFFMPFHLYHLREECAVALPYLALPPGWRFLIADGHEDVWFDDSLLEV
jgi:hypothetical protein